jgi:hypothetical protein
VFIIGNQSQSASGAPKVSHAGEAGWLSPFAETPAADAAQPPSTGTIARRSGKVSTASGLPPRQCGLLSISSRFPLNLIDAAENKEMGRAFHNTICTHEVRFMSSLALREDARQAGEASISISARPASQSKPASASIEGVLLFSGIGFGLMVLAAIFGYLELPPPYF